MRVFIEWLCNRITDAVEPYHHKLKPMCVELMERNLDSFVIASIALLAMDIHRIRKMESCLDEFYENTCWGE